MNIKDYEKLQKVWLETNGLKVGDHVKIVRKVEEGELGWYNSWTDRMTELVGTSGKIVDIEIDGIVVESEITSIGIRKSTIWNYPFFALEKYEKIISFVIESDCIIKDDLRVRYDGKTIWLNVEFNRFALTLDQMKEIFEKIENEY